MHGEMARSGRALTSKQGTSILRRVGIKPANPGASDLQRKIETYDHGPTLPAPPDPASRGFAIRVLNHLRDRWNVTTRTNGSPATPPSSMENSPHPRANDRPRRDPASLPAMAAPRLGIAALRIGTAYGNGTPKAD